MEWGPGRRPYAVPVKDPFQGLAEILQQVRAVGHLGGRGCARRDGFREPLVPAPRPHLDRGMGGEPRRDRRRLAVQQDVHFAMRFLMDENVA
ncbi:MAG: hypothetical protein ACP5QO_10780 [Clostridia bacterium]